MGTNSTRRHVEEMVGKSQKAANAAWGMMKRAARDRRDDRIYLMNSLVRSVALYGVETWG
ncbi:Protein of unknown function [Cotesia congregata]|uniref:Uncharacterized protein n=1 Tax=Cotesia congregata TaxID=51543 RepID=A0A8J2MR13_COTCN|nr:Protein of unknown function [Cotesia congregata]